MLADAKELTQAEDVVVVELWASHWLGEAWGTAGIGERAPEVALYTEVVDRAVNGPSPQGLAAVAALRRLAAEPDQRLLDEILDTLAASQPRPLWIDAPGWTPVAAWRAVDVWESEHMLIVEFDGASPHTLAAAVTTVGGSRVSTLAVAKAGAAAAWLDVREDGMPMPLSAQPVAEVLAELADLLQTTDMYWPRNNDQDFVDLRALAWSRCRAYLERPAESSWEPISAEDTGRLVADFVLASELPDDEVTRSLAEVFIDYGDGYLAARPLGWSPGSVGVFLSDWLPRKVTLLAEQRAALPEALRRWVRFALQRRGVDPEWIEPVVVAVDAHLPEFEKAFGDTSTWRPAKQLATALVARGVDLTDKEAVDAAIREINAENLAPRLLDE